RRLGDGLADNAQGHAAAGAVDLDCLARVGRGLHVRNDVAAARALGRAGAAGPLNGLHEDAAARPARSVAAVVVKAGHGRADNNGVEAAGAAELLLPAGDSRGFLTALELRQGVDGVLGDDDEQRGVDGVDAFAKDGALPAALTALAFLAFAKERARVLVVVAGDNASQGLAGQERLAVARVDVADLALRNRDQAAFVDT